MSRYLDGPEQLASVWCMEEGVEMTRVSEVMLADVPEDGGKWMIMCEHDCDGEVIVGGVLQDTNKRRLSEWRTSVWADGRTTWCPMCQDAHEYGVA